MPRENNKECACAGAPEMQPVEVPEECEKDPEIPWQVIIYVVNGILAVAMTILCLYHPDDLDAEAEEFKPDPGLIGWRPLPEEGAEAPEPDEPELDYGWRVLKDDEGGEEVEPEWGLKPDWGWRPFNEEEGGGAA